MEEGEVKVEREVEGEKDAVHEEWDLDRSPRREGM